ncbi:MAG TPA: P-II family nitrogen regulator [Acidobacteriota bacterium]|nr:P-II family nitrogen regulator [Acidobacteriota bacterium]
MKKLEAYVQPFRVKKVKEALAEEGFEEVHTLDVRDQSHRSYSERLRGTEYNLDLLPRTLVIAFIADEKVDQAVDLVQEAAHTSHGPSGKIVISNVDSVVPIG